MNQRQKIEKLSTPHREVQFYSERSLIQYISVCKSPYICASSQLLASVKDPVTPSEIKALSKIIQRLKQTEGQGLTYIPIYLSTERLMLIREATFSNARNENIQLGYIILISDSTGGCNIVNYYILHWKMVNRSLIAAEVHALVPVFDNFFFLIDMTTEILSKLSTIEEIFDAKPLFACVSKYANTTEKLLQLYIFSLREGYTHGDLDRISRIPGLLNPADGLKKSTTTNATLLWKLMTKNYLNPEECGGSTVHTNSIYVECS